MVVKHMMTGNNSGTLLLTILVLTHRRSNGCFTAMHRVVG